MKNILFLMLIFLFSNRQSFAQGQKDSIPEPEFMNQVYQYDKINKKLVELEKVNAEMKSKIKLMGGGSVVYSIDGSRSEARINSEKINSENSSFMITIAGGTMMSDPSMTLKLYKLDNKKSKREVPMGQYGASGKGNNQVDLKFKKLKDGIYEIVVSGRLEKGEYGFINMNAMGQTGNIPMFTFGLD
jgi:hypothetical protein